MAWWGPIIEVDTITLFRQQGIPVVRDKLLDPFWGFWESSSASEICLPSILFYLLPMTSRCGDKKVTVSSLTGMVLRATLFPDIWPRLTSLPGCSLFNCLKMCLPRAFPSKFCQLPSQESAAEPKGRRSLSCPYQQVWQCTQQVLIPSMFQKAQQTLGAIHCWALNFPSSHLPVVHKRGSGAAWLLDRKAHGCGASCYGFHSSKWESWESVRRLAGWNHVLGHCSLCTLPFWKSQVVPVVWHMLGKYGGSLALQKTETWWAN